MTLADQIRDFVDRRYITPARRQNHPTVTLNVGAVHREMALQNRVPAVCAALQSKIFERQCGVTLVAWDGPKQSTSVQITYSLGPHTGGKQAASTAEPPSSPVTAGDLNAWRHLLVQLLAKIDPRPVEKEGLVAKIKRLSALEHIPKETAALMISVAEMRNSTEYRAKQPSRLEGDAVKNSWLAIVEWAKTRGIPVGS